MWVTYEKVLTLLTLAPANNIFSVILKKPLLAAPCRGMCFFPASSLIPGCFNRRSTISSKPFSQATYSGESCAEFGILTSHPKGNGNANGNRFTRLILDRKQA